MAQPVLKKPTTRATTQKEKEEAEKRKKTIKKTKEEPKKRRKFVSQLDSDEEKTKSDDINHFKVVNQMTSVNLPW